MKFVTGEGRNTLAPKCHLGLDATPFSCSLHVFHHCLFQYCLSGLLILSESLVHHNLCRLMNHLPSPPPSAASWKPARKVSIPTKWHIVNFRVVLFVGHMSFRGRGSIFSVNSVHYNVMGFSSLYCTITVFSPLGTLCERTGKLTAT